MSQNNRHRDPSDAETGKKRKKKTNQQPRSRMEIAVYIIGVAVVILGLLSAVFFSVERHRDAGRWTTCAAIVLAVIGAFCWYQDMLWKKDEIAANAGKQTDRNFIILERARLVIENFRFIISQDRKSFTWTFAVVNRGKTPAHVIERCLGWMNWDDATPLPKKPIYAGIVNKGQFVINEGQYFQAEDEWMPCLIDQIPVLYAVGYYKYLDDFGIERITRYGFRYRPGKSAILINDRGYNSAD